jgi:hypothetical protein
MRCPFLREAQVKFCQVAPSHKLILRMPQLVVHEKCTSADYITCPSARECHVDFPDQNRCPLLQESLMQYCAAAPVIRYLPYSEPLLSRCGNETHLSCDLYLAMADPEACSTGHTIPSDRKPG